MRHLVKSYLKSNRRYDSYYATFNVYELLKLSEDELHSNDYETPSPSCVRFFKTHTEAAYDAGIPDLLEKLFDDNISITEEILSDIIIKCIKFMTDNYQMEYWSFPENEYDRATQTYRDVSLKFQEQVWRWANNSEL